VVTALLLVRSGLLTKVIFQPSATDYGTYDYTRSGNPTRDVLQRLVQCLFFTMCGSKNALSTSADEFDHIFSLMAKLEKADQAFCFTSGMAALAAVTHLLRAGKHLPFPLFIPIYFS
jgi:cysteine-S-conjugate beta-lyase